MALVSSSALCANPIFILGISQRSGTNFLYDLLCLHPDVAPTAIWEDFLAHHADLLIKYTDTVFNHWPPSCQVKDRKDALGQFLGNGLISFLASQIDNDEIETRKRLLTKTPSVHNLGYFFRLFPRAHLLVLVRDGRAVVESRVKSSGSHYEVVMREWADAARTILCFDQTAENSNFKYLIVRYKDIYGNSKKELCKIFTFLGLDAKAYDFDAAVNLPVRGSSALRGQEGVAVHWHPIEKTSDFNPLQRWSHWDRALHERFNWIAGQYLVELGYKEKQYATNQLLWVMWNKAMDTRWPVREFMWPILGKIFRKAPLKVQRFLNSIRGRTAE